MAIKVKLRQKAISGKRQSLYLDFYPQIIHPETGKPTRREFLKMYILGSLTTDGKGLDKRVHKKLAPLHQIHDENTYTTAEQIRQGWENRLNKPEIYSGYEKEQLRIKEQGEKNFVSYFKTLANKRKASNYDNWISACHYLESFTKGRLKFSDLNETFCNDFKDYLLTTQSNKSNKTTLSQNTAVSYFNKLKASLKQAYKDGYLSYDLNARIEPIKQAETRRNFLTIEELNRLINTDCGNPLLKRAALFSALTGLRFSDIANLVWRNIEYIEGNGYVILFQQQKTKGVENLPISEQAYSLLGERKEPTAQVFEGLKYSAYENRHLAKWIGLAGIDKDITFHCFRHTYAILLLLKGVDIYTVMKLMGHRDLKTTMIYAKVADQTKREAAEKIQLDFTPKQ